MKVSKVIECLNDYSPDDEIMISWWDREGFEYVMDKPLPLEIWEMAVAKFDRSDWSSWSEDTHSFVIVAKDLLENQVSA